MLIEEVDSTGTRTVYVAVYIHFDGYLTGVGADIAEFLIEMFQDETTDSWNCLNRGKFLPHEASHLAVAFIARFSVGLGGSKVPGGAAVMSSLISSVPKYDIGFRILAPGEWSFGFEKYNYRVTCNYDERYGDSPVRRTFACSQSDFQSPAGQVYA